MIEKFYQNGKPTPLMIRISEVVVLTATGICVIYIGVKIWEVFTYTLAMHPEVTTIWN